MLTRKCRELGIRQRFSASHEQHQNGPVERKVGIVKAKVKKLVSMSGMPDKLWPHAVGHAVWLMNRTPSKPLTHPADGRSMTPYEAYHPNRQLTDNHFTYRSSLGTARLKDSSYTGGEHFGLPGSRIFAERASSPENPL